jgi:drug/metabolite transporter (DMT)-like permease
VLRAGGLGGSELEPLRGRFQIGLARTAVGLMLLLAALAIRPALKTQVTASDPVLHVLRNAIHTAGGVLWTVAIATLPFATVFSLEFTAPAWVALLAYPLLGERIRHRAVIGIVVCTIGVLAILRPGPPRLGPLPRSRRSRRPSASPFR